jgi:HSP20 family protein
MERSLARRRRRPHWMMPFGEDPVGDAWFDRLWPMWPTWRGREEEFTPPFNFYEKDGEYHLTAELPGINKDDISIDIDNDTLTIRGKKSFQREDEGADFYFSESRYGSFSRSIRLPGKVDEDRMEATFKDGVLKVKMIQKESPERRRIEIKG